MTMIGTRVLTLGKQHADILSDLAAALAGSIGIAPTSNLDPTRQNPSMFEPIHGSAFDITGMGIGKQLSLPETISLSNRPCSKPSGYVLDVRRNAEMDRGG